MLVHRSISVLSTSKFPFQPNIFSLLKTNYPSLVLFSNPCSKFCSLKSRAFATTLAASTSVSDADTFLAEEGVTWAALGVSDSITRALCNVGLHRPSLVQAACIPTILSGTDVVVAAETGSGKTHGYLVPLLHKLQMKMNMSENPVDDVIKPGKHRDVSLVLCPNVMLCEQVVRMANSLCDESGIPLVKTAAICGRQELSFKEPDIIVSTPVALLNYLFAIDPEKRRRDNFIRGVKYVVFDEADLLLCGSFQNQVIRLINMLRFDEKQLSRTQAADTGVNDTESSSVKVSDAEEDDVKYDPTEDDGEDEDEDPNNRFLVEEPENESEIRGRKDWRRFRKAYKRSKQYVFIAATLPVNGKQTAGGILKRLFPEANWVSGNYLHQHNPRLVHKWIEVTTDTQVDALISAVKSGLNIETDDSNPIVRTMVFANTVEAVEAIGKILTGAGITCMRYHSNMSLEERTKNLFDFQQRGGVFVCTGAAARGLDVPHISHVIQAEFASCAVDFLHRVGRTARAGRHGLVTSLFTESNRDLVHAVRRAEQLGLPVEKAFSRKRSFRKKLKKRARDSTSSVREQVSA